MLYAPAICFVLGLGVLSLFLIRTYGFAFASIVALLLATLPGSIERSAAGFSDRDSWCWLFGILAVIPYLWKEQTQPKRLRLLLSALSGFFVCLGGLSWEGFGAFVLMISCVELWKFLTTETEARLEEYGIWLLMFVPWLYLASPAYQNGQGFSTHLTALVLVLPIAVFGIRALRHLFLAFAQRLRPHARKLARFLTLLALTAAFGYVFIQRETFALSTVPFSNNRLMQIVTELVNPHFGYWWARYGGVFVLGSLGLIAGSVRLWKWKGVPLAFALCLFVLTTFFRAPLSGWLGADQCNTLFFAALVCVGIGMGVVCLRKEPVANELVAVIAIAWFLLWVGLARGAKRYDFFIGTLC